MKKSIFTRVMMLAMMAAVCMTFTACGGDDDGTPAGGGDNGGGGDKPNSVLFVNGTNYGLLPYAWFMKWTDGSASFIISNQNTIQKGLDKTTGYTYVAVRFPNYDGAIPLGTYNANLDLDFDINRKYTSETASTVDMTGWSTKLVITIDKRDDKYIVDISTEDLHILKNDNEQGDGQKGFLNIHYEGPLDTYGLSLG